MEGACTGYDPCEVAERVVDIFMLPTNRRPEARAARPSGGLGVLGSQPFPAVGSGKLAKVRVQIDGQSIVALLDSGCGACVAGQHLIDALERKSQEETKRALVYKPIDMALRTAKRGETVQVLGTVDATLRLSPQVEFRIGIVR